MEPSDGALTDATQSVNKEEASTPSGKPWVSPLALRHGIPKTNEVSINRSDQENRPPPSDFIRSNQEKRLQPVRIAVLHFQ